MAWCIALTFKWSSSGQQWSSSRRNGTTLKQHNTRHMIIIESSGQMSQMFIRFSTWDVADDIAWKISWMKQFSSYQNVLKRTVVWWSEVSAPSANSRRFESNSQSHCSVTNLHKTNLANLINLNKLSAVYFQNLIGISVKLFQCLFLSLI